MKPEGQGGAARPVLRRLIWYIERGTFVHTLASSGTNSKRLTNIDKHGVDFRLAAAIFFGPTIEADDTREDYGELRRLALGRVGTDHFVVGLHPSGADTAIHQRMEGWTT